MTNEDVPLSSLLPWSTLDRYPVVVAKVIIPKLFPLYLYEPFAPLKNTRLKEAAKNLNLNHLAKLNPLPHPFP